MIKLTNLLKEVNQETIDKDFQDILSKLPEDGNKKYFKNEYNKAKDYISKLKVYNKLKDFKK